VISRSPDSHVNEHCQALDFLVPEGTPVLAAAAGTVVEIVHWHNEGGPSREFTHTLNYVTLRHRNDEFTQYAHLAPRAFPYVALNGVVQRGQLLGHVGMTGWTDRPHLHFLVFRNIQLPPGFKSLVPRFA
jgi:murein DD-endopeptidase MepM/ murein hydrolase activator NlpD